MNKFRRLLNFDLTCDGHVGVTGNRFVKPAATELTEKMFFTCFLQNLRDRLSRVLYADFGYIDCGVHTVDDIN